MSAKTYAWLTPACPLCGQASLLEELSASEYLALRAWEARELLIQDALPDWSLDRRELVQTGTHPACWERMFPDED
jgi:hypothetical protein